LTDITTQPGGLARRSLLRQERSKETRRNLLRTAIRLWGERGVDAVTVEEICAAAGVGRTTFYLHFDSKEGLLSSLPGATATGVAAELDHVRGTSSLDDQLEVFVAGIVRRMEGVPKALADRVLHSQRVQDMKARAQDGPREGLLFADMLAGVLADARGRGELVADADTVELGAMLGALTLDAIETWASRRSEDIDLGPLLRFRFAVVIDQFRSAAPKRARRTS
jgi:AcrR family transcriptional regulator